jgi:hypothetical protein
VRAIRVGGARRERSAEINTRLAVDIQQPDRQWDRAEEIRARVPQRRALGERCRHRARRAGRQRRVGDLELLHKVDGPERLARWPAVRDHVRVPARADEDASTIERAEPPA